MDATAIRSWCWGWCRYARRSTLGDTVYYCRKAASTSNTIQYRPVDWSSVGPGWRLTIAWPPVGRPLRQRAAPLPGCSAGKHRCHGTQCFFHLEDITAAAASGKRWASVSVRGQWVCCCGCCCCRARGRGDEICPLLRNRGCSLSLRRLLLIEWRLGSLGEDGLPSGSSCRLCYTCSGNQQYLARIIYPF